MGVGGGREGVREGGTEWMGEGGREGMGEGGGLFVTAFICFFFCLYMLKRYVNNFLMSIA